MDSKEEQTNSEVTNLENESLVKEQKDANDIDESNVGNQLDEKSKDIDEQGVRWPLGWLQEKVFRKFGAIPVDRKENSRQYDSVVKELRKRDSFLLIVTPEGRFDADRFRTSFLYIARELNAEVMPVQIDYENQIFNILESFEIDGDIEDVIKKLRIKFDGIKGKKSRFKA